MHHCPNATAGSAAAVFCLACSFTCSAQPAADAQPDKEGAQTAQASVEEIVVHARRNRRSGAGISPAGASDYKVSADDIKTMPAGEDTPVSEVLTQLPGVAIDQNQQIHIRNTEGPQFQYNINGILVPFDINTNPPFLTMLNATFINRLDLLTGILPSRYSYATGGVIDIETKDGCASPGGRVSLQFGQRQTLQPTLEYGGCSGRLSYYGSLRTQQSNTAFSPATPGPDPVHDRTSQGQGFGFVSYALSDKAKLSVIVSDAASNNELPNVPGLPRQYALAGAPPFGSARIDSSLDFRDELAIVSLTSAPSADLSYQIAYAVHSIGQHFVPDRTGELVFQGVASTATHQDFDNTLQGDVSYRAGQHTATAGFYEGAYHVIADDSSLVFPASADGSQASNVPIRVVNNAAAVNLLSGLYIDDLWQLTDRLKLNAGLRWDSLTGFTNHNQFNPTFNLIYDATARTTLHAGVARTMQVPSFQGISPTASAAFANTTAAGPAGVSTPQTEDDVEFDAGAITHIGPRITISQDFYYEMTHRYLDTGQFGVVPIFAPFNYGHGTIWGSETAINYRAERLSAYATLTVGRNVQQGVLTGQFNFPPDELATIDRHHIVLDHQPLAGASAGISYRLAPFAFGLDAIYSSGLRGGFADQEHLPAVFQLNAGVGVDLHLPGIGLVTDRLTVVNLADRTNLIRPAEGIGIFQSAYGPRLTLLDTISVSF